MLTVADDYAFRPDTFTVAPGRVRRTVLSSAEQLTHNFASPRVAAPAAIEEQVEILPPGIEDTVEFTVDRVGDYGFDCSFHVALGQVGTTTVVAGEGQDRWDRGESTATTRQEESCLTPPPPLRPRPWSGAGRTSPSSR